MLIVKVISIVITAAVLSLTVKQYRPEYTALIAISAGAVLLIMLRSSIEGSIDTVNSLLNHTGINSEYVSILLKTLGICILTQIAADICRDANESALATKAEIAGKVIILTISLPMITSIAEIALELIQQ